MGKKASGNNRDDEAGDLSSLTVGPMPAAPDSSKQRSGGPLPSLALSPYKSISASDSSEGSIASCNFIKYSLESHPTLSTPWEYR